jgi:CHAD domain-containing protein
MTEAEHILIEEEPPAAASPPVRQPRNLIEIINSQLVTLRNYHRAVIETGSEDAVHKMRVTTRRLQASLDLLERELKVRKIKRRLRGWRRKLSTVRNLDVFLELIEKEAASRGRTRREQLELIRTTLQERRVLRALKVTRFLKHIDIDAIAINLGLGLPMTDELTPALETRTTDGAGDEVQESAPIVAAPLAAPMVIDEGRVAGYAAERLEQRLAEFQVLAAQSHPTNDPTELHQLRIAAKRVRYLLEIVSEMGYGDASRALNWLRNLQDRIGDWHDLEALEEEIIGIVANHDFLKQNLSESSRMIQAAAHLQKKKLALVSRLFPVRVPKTLEVTSRRIARSLRRASLRPSP